ncbi:NAD-dependent succinate-semialdehyde dehydrogenase [Alteribacillus bidgolensis]|uniref:Succinate-semialdehyde dehydrogenase / glutarate-semialdehyde dehydrogenase n=1 Tax=Alteribacillus bidgolensis TaxID=930129 RepID=A0A1G8NLV3_9BACI|nr:NAD-dependent succinate-semialdehyde dehydrogenase [Alteribacillus bidgolensis]SDI81107.1 succinate-semialdehyde dehydrogenase / glutarate-semialdehyde dehydrogenase [Alteribacillus bidgolensis]
MYINGQWITTNEKMDVINPATLEKIADVSIGGRQETKHAIASAKSAFSSWGTAPGTKRSHYLANTAQQLRRNRNELAETITTEMGKPLSDAKREVESAIDYVEWYAEEAKRIYGEVIPASHENKHLMVIQQPIGVAAAITPWNFPVSMITRKIAPALAAGCTVVLKPAPSTPLSAIKVFECFHAAELPKGVVNLVIGPAKEIGPELTGNPDVRKITFTGSTAVGKKLMRDAADTVKKVSMELGGHAPFIVFEDADLDEAVKGILATKFKAAGQTCISTNRIFAEKNIAEKLGKKLAEQAAQLKVGNGLEDVDVGPLINESAVAKADSHVKDAVSQNGEVLCGGKPYSKLNGYFYEPTVITGAHKEMKIANEETFGPVAPIFTFEEEEEIAAMVNHEQYGLAAYCFTKDLSRGYRMMNQLEYGIVGINDPAPIVAQAPFGGIKESGMGKEGGTSGLKEYLEEKYVSIKTG